MKKILPILILVLSFSTSVCSFKQSKQSEPVKQSESISKEKSIEIEQAVRQFYAAKQPPIKLIGINPTSHGSYYRIQADIEVDGKRNTRYLYYRSYQSQGNTYWKVEE